ncbi:unnamed protein product [Meganyctiphanes norvegica]|uniref:Uncharacterized protein n=1 Tax=Meganyctiphanes norvegica TaxID=48144 RepID=A0AAV2SGZ4_MEGNR
MFSLAVASVVLGVAMATPVLPRDDINVAHARNAFLQEYNRLAALAAAAPDIHIIMGTRQLPHQVPVTHVNNVPAGHLADHLAGHLAGHQVPVINPTPTFVPSGPIMTWTGPFADTVPAGVNGLPQQVRETPEVAAARAALVRAHAKAPRPNPLFNPPQQVL